jgi:diacylglycerol O-acyltransferase
MSAVDTAWLRMDRPNNLMVICAVMTLRDRIDHARVAATIGRHFLRYARFRKRPVDSDGATYWEADSILRTTSSRPGCRAGPGRASCRRSSAGS